MSFFTRAFLKTLPAAVSLPPKTHRSKSYFGMANAFLVEAQPRAEAGALIAQVQPMNKKLKPDIIGFEEVRDGDAVPIARKGVSDTAAQGCRDFLDEGGARTTQ